MNLPPRYEVRGLIGQGAQGAVYDGFDTERGVDVAIKVGALPHAPTPPDHPNIVRVFAQTSHFMVMERLRGTTLQMLVEQAPLSEADARKIGAAVARALSHAHAQGIVHCDVKPDNIFVEPSGRVVLIDFGVAVTEEGIPFGTPLFGSPEQCTGLRRVTPQSDLFSLGSVLYFALTQVYPFQGETLEGLLEALTTRDPYPIDQLIEISKPLRGLLSQLLQKDPGLRPASASDVAETLSLPF